MLSDEEKEEALSETEIRFRADLLILNSEFPTHRKTEAMEELLEIYNKQQKEIEELKNTKKELTERVLRLESDKFWDNVVSKDKIKAKIEVMNTNIVNAEKFDCDYIGQCRFAKYVLQSLLEKE